MSDFTVTVPRRTFLGLMSVPFLPGIAFSQDASGDVSGGTLIASIYPEPAQLTTAVSNHFTVLAVSTNIFDGLLSYDENLNPVPSLAESWDISPDHLSVTFHLRKGVKWHDGQDFTSEDVRYSALELWKKLHPRGRGNFIALQDVETPDAHTAIFRLSTPSPIILNALNSAESQVLPAHLYKGTDPLTNPHNSEPIGTGPFVFKSRERGVSIELVRNPDYWDAGKPLLDSIIFRPIADPASRSAALEVGEVQYAPYSPVPLSDLPRIREDESLVVVQRGYSWESPLFFFEFNLKDPIVADPRVRQAFAHAIDRQGLVDTVWYGQAKAAVGPIPSQLENVFTDQVPRYDFDPAAAEKLLDAAGYPRKEDGKRFSITHDYSAGEAEFESAVQYIKQNLAAVGIDFVPRTAEYTIINKRIYTDYDFQTRSGKFAAMIDPALGLYRLYWSKSYVKGVPNTNASGYNNPEMDRIIESVRSEPDMAKRVELFHQWQHLAMTDLPTIPLVELRYFTVYNKNLDGVSILPEGVTAALKGISLRQNG